MASEGATRTQRAPKEEGDERRHIGKSRGGEHDTGPGGGKAKHAVGGNARGKEHGRTRGSGDRSAGQRSGDK